jgi:hypothetical protein
LLKKRQKLVRRGQFFPRDFQPRVISVPDVEIVRKKQPVFNKIGAVAPRVFDDAASAGFCTRVKKETLIDRKYDCNQ